uniref:Uncharacterized protein n=1 Tax=Acrobeloides nanus TaxID=290746 RepID=A0A914EH79_9BILA
MKEKVSEYAEAAKEAIFGKPEDDTSGNHNDPQVLGLPIEETVSENLQEENEPSGRVLLENSGTHYSRET